MINVTLYQKEDCHLCEQVRKDLEEIQEKIPHKLITIDIDSDETLRDMFAVDIPVVEIGPYRLKYPFSKQDLEMTLRAANDRQNQLIKVDDERYKKAAKRGTTFTSADNVSLWISNHYLLILNLFVLLYVGLPFSAPILKEAGADFPAEIIYRIYRPLCHQWSFRSFFLFGEQLYYPHESASISGLKTFEEVSGISDSSDPKRLQARLFEGNNVIGYKVALCERDVAIWGSMLFFGIVFSLSHRKIKSVHWIAWILIGIGPIALDGVSQVISQFNLPWLLKVLPYRESTPLLRTISGFLFGWFTAWYGLPPIEEVMSETRISLNKKMAVIKENSLAKK